MSIFDDFNLAVTLGVTEMSFGERGGVPFGQATVYLPERIAYWEDEFAQHKEKLDAYLQEIGFPKLTKITGIQLEVFVSLDRKKVHAIVIEWDPKAGDGKEWVKG